MILLAILLTSFILRVINLNQSLWLDEAINVLAAKNYSFLGMITEYAKADFHPPGYFIILWMWAKIFGTSEIAVRMPSVIFGVLTVYVIYLIGKNLHSKTLGFLSAFLLAINPLHVYYSQEARMYSLATLAVSLNVLFFIKLIKREKINPLFLIAGNFLVLLSDYVSYFIFPAQFIFLLTLKKKEVIKKWFTQLLFALLLFSIWSPIFLNQLNVGSVTSDRLPAWKLIVGGFDFKAVPLTFVKFIIGRISYPDKFIYAVVLLPVSLLFLFIIFRGIKFVKGLERSLLIIWLGIPIILGTIISFIVPIFSYFRMLFILPPFVFTVALGIISFKSRLRIIILVIVTLIQLYSTSVYLFNPSYQREDWKGLVNFLISNGKNSLILFESSGTLPPFDYYAKGVLNAKGALRDFPLKNADGLADLENLSSGLKDLYLVDYLVDISDPGRLVKERLNMLGYKLIETKDFHGVGFLYHYVK